MPNKTFYIYTTGLGISGFDVNHHIWNSTILVTILKNIPASFKNIEIYHYENFDATNDRDTFTNNIIKNDNE